MNMLFDVTVGTITMCLSLYALYGVSWVIARMIDRIRGVGDDEGLIDIHRGETKAADDSPLCFNCPHCGRSIRGNRSMIGDIGICPKCRNEFTITDETP